MFNSRLDERRGAHEALHRGQGLAWPAEFIVHTFKAFFGGGGGQSETFPWSCVAAVTTLFKKHANGNSFGSVDMTVKISMAFDSLKISECKSHFLLGQIRCISRDRYLLHRT